MQMAESDDTKAHMIKTIKEWVSLDSEIQKLKNELAPRVKEHRRLSIALHEICRQTGISTFDLKDGKLCYKTKKCKKPLTKKVLLQALGVYFQGDNDKVKPLHDFIHQCREEQIKETVKMKAVVKET
jgi:hypothetical protein